LLVGGVPGLVFGDGAAVLGLGGELASANSFWWLLTIR
jgi:hypothetical protein